mmetsp:Transcript_13433/g.26781  ORF Transcript_13433/g.26781 Transcript_13433/m.26781 type:complete len:189 (+) Transcript_13433:158-724(+)
MTSSAHHVMMMTFDAFPEHTLSVFLVPQLVNARELRQSLMSGTLEPEAALIDAGTLAHLLIVKAAAGLALQHHARGTLRTKTLHSELVYSLSGSKHIGSSLGTFGIKDDTACLLVAKFDASDEDMNALRNLVASNECILEEEEDINAYIDTCRDEKAITKAYKIVDQELQIGSLVDAIVCRIAARDCL